jgi:hypothetical protein
MEEPTDDMLRRPTLDSAWGRSSLEGRSTASGPNPFEPEQEPARSLRLRFVTGFYLLATVGGAVSLLLMVYSALMDTGEMRARIRDYPVAMLTKPLTLVSTWVTWRLLRQRRRLGIVAAAIPFLNVLYIRATSLGATEWYNLLFPALSVLFFASIWKELE